MLCLLISIFIMQNIKSYRTYCCGYVVVGVDCRVQINGGRIVDVLRTMVGMVSILEC